MPQKQNKNQAKSKQQQEKHKRKKNKASGPPQLMGYLTDPHQCSITEYITKRQHRKRPQLVI